MSFNLWHNYLYQPVFNFLIWIYNNWTDMNFGWAVVYLTIILRILLLPFSLINERNRVKNAQIEDGIRKLEKEYHTDAIQRKEEIRRLLKQQRVQPWARVIVLGVQLLVLILLYQVFLRGITGEKILSILYPWVDFPGYIETNFYGFELGEVRTFVWPGIVAVWLFAEIYVDLHKKGKIKKKDLMFFLLFPTFVFVILWYLPMVKSLFILTSMAFSFIVAVPSKAIFSAEPKKA